MWMSKLRQHRDYRLHELNKDATLTHHSHSVSDGLMVGFMLLFFVFKFMIFDLDKFFKNDITFFY